MIGYMLEQALGNALPGRRVATLLTQVVVDAADPAFQHPTKPIGPVYERAEAERLAAERGFAVAADGDRLAPGRALTRAAAASSRSRRSGYSSRRACSSSASAAAACRSRCRRPARWSASRP